MLSTNIFPRVNHHHRITSHIYYFYLSPLGIAHYKIIFVKAVSKENYSFIIFHTYSSEVKIVILIQVDIAILLGIYSYWSICNLKVKTHIWWKLQKHTPCFSSLPLYLNFPTLHARWLLVIRKLSSLIDLL